MKIMFRKMNKDFLKGYFIGLVFLVPILFLILLPINDSDCHKIFGLKTCVIDHIKYQFSSLSGKCYIKDYNSKGIANDTVHLSTDIYLVSNKNYPLNFTHNDLAKTSIEVNDIWNEYGIFIDIENITEFSLGENEIPIKLTAENVRNISTKIVKDKLYDGSIDIILAPKFKQKFFFLYIDSSLEGIGWRGFPNENRSILLIMMTPDVKNVSWNLAHEFGHILGNLDYSFYSGQFNLMTHSGCVKDEFYPTILDQQQVNIVISTANGIIKNNY